MELKLFALIGILTSVVILISFTESTRLNSDDIIYYSIRQYTKLSASLDGKNGFIHTGNPLSPEWNLTPLSSWTVGFYGGTLWMLFKLTHDPFWKELALEYQERVKPRQFDTGTHDVGFVIMSTFGLALEYGGMDDSINKEYGEIINQTAISLSSRFHRKLKNIRISGIYIHTENSWFRILKLLPDVFVPGTATTVWSSSLWTT